MPKDDKDLTKGKAKGKEKQEKKEKARPRETLSYLVRRVVQSEAGSRFAEREIEGLVHDAMLMLLHDARASTLSSMPRRQHREAVVEIGRLVRRLVQERMMKGGPYVPYGIHNVLPIKTEDLSEERFTTYQVFEDIVSKPRPEKPPRLLFEVRKRLTTELLGTQVIPYLDALTTLQNTIDDLHGFPRKPIVIENIRYWNPLGIDLQGLDEAIKVLRNLIVPFWRAHAKELAEIEKLRALAEVKKLEAEILKVRADSEKDLAAAKQMKAEAAKSRADARRTTLEGKKFELEMKAKLFELARTIVTDSNSSLPAEQRIGYANKIGDSLNTLTHSQIELKQIEGKGI